MHESTSRSSRRSSGWRPARSIGLLVLATGCGIYTFTGGGGLPGNIRTLAIPPFENETTQFTLTQELTQAMLDQVPGRLGLKSAGQSTADAVLRGKIVRYSDAATNFQADPNGPVIFQRRVTITVSVELYDVQDDQVLWQSSSLSADGEYLPDKQGEIDGRRLAIANLVQKIIDGAQSQW